MSYFLAGLNYFKGFVFECDFSLYKTISFLFPLISKSVTDKSNQLHTLARTLASTKHQAVWGPRAGQVVFGRATLLLTFSSQRDYNRVNS
jgi:hypothetical protein